MTDTHHAIAGWLGKGGRAAIATGLVALGSPLAAQPSVQPIRPVTGAPFAGDAPTVAPAPPVAPPIQMEPRPAPVFESVPVIQPLPTAKTPVAPVVLTPVADPLPLAVTPPLLNPDTVAVAPPLPDPATLAPPLPPAVSEGGAERGLRLDPVFLDAAYTVADTRAWGLPSAPVGLRWVRAYDDAALVGADGVVREVRRDMEWDRRAAVSPAVDDRAAARTGDRFYDPRCFGGGDPLNRSALGPCPPDASGRVTGRSVAVLRPRMAPGSVTVRTVTTPAPIVTTVVVEEYGPDDPD